MFENIKIKNKIQFFANYKKVIIMIFEKLVYKYENLVNYLNHPLLFNESL